MKKFFFLLICLFSLSACFNPFTFPFNLFDGDDATRDPEGTLHLAVGGVLADHDTFEIKPPDGITAADISLNTDNADQLTLAITAEDPITVQATPSQGGTNTIRIFANSEELDQVNTITPPQAMIQILVAEARGQLATEAHLKDDNVSVGSISATGEAIASVIKNRVMRLQDGADPALFEVDGAAFASHPPDSEYEAVIEATRDGSYQFSPIHPDNTNHQLYIDAAQRANLSDDELLAYDQAVMSAAFIFGGGVSDPTEGAFAFFSPTKTQYDAIEAALLSETKELDPATGISDDNFPALAPIQILILSKINEVPDEDYPAFVFIRSRTDIQPAVVSD